MDRGIEEAAKGRRNISANIYATTGKPTPLFIPPANL